MSYVLNALRRADAERGRGQVPGLNDQPAPALGAAGPAATRPGSRAVWGGAALLAVAGLVLAGWLVGRDRAPGPAPAPTPQAAPVAAPQTVAPAPVAPAAPAPQVLIRIEAPVASPAPAPTQTAAPVRAEPVPMAAGPAVLRLRDLSEPERRQWPALSFGGAMDSPVAANRMLIINGEVVREGESPAPGLVLERVQLRSAVFAWRGRRIEVEY